MKLIPIVAIFLITFNDVTSISIDCSFRHFDALGYCCDPTSIQITSKNDRTVTSVSGSHQGGLGNGNVKCLRIHKKVVNYMPRNLETFFPNLDAIQVVDTNLVEVTVDDFKPYGSKLIRVHFDKVEIAVVEADLFKYNPNLEFVSFYFAKVRHVENGAFANLNRLITLYFESNPCINANAVNDRTGVLSLINRVEVYCKDAYFDRQHSNAIPSSLTNEIQSLKQEIAQLRTEKSQCNNEVENSSDALIHKFEESCSSLKSDLFEVKDKVQQLTELLNRRRP